MILLKQSANVMEIDDIFELELLLQHQTNIKLLTKQLSM